MDCGAADWGWQAVVDTCPESSRVDGAGGAIALLDLRVILKGIARDAIVVGGLASNED